LRVLPQDRRTYLAFREALEGCGRARRGCPASRYPWEFAVRLTSSLAQQHVTLGDAETETVDLASWNLAMA